MRTYFPKQGDIEPKWFIIDAEGKILGAPFDPRSPGSFPARASRHTRRSSTPVTT